MTAPFNNLQVFTPYVYRSYTEVLRQQLDLFNEATNDCITLVNQDNAGDYREEASWKRLTSIVRRRNAYDNSDVAEVNMEHILDRSVKVAAGIKPVRLLPHEMQWIGQDPKGRAAALAQQVAIATMSDFLNTGIQAGIAAMGQIDALKVTDAAAATDTWNASNFNDAARLFGDRSTEISCWVMHSKVAHDFWGHNIDNANRLFSYGTINVRTDPFDRPIIITDSDALVQTVAANGGVPQHKRYTTLGLTPQSIVIQRNSDFLDNLQTINGKENITTTYQAQWSFNMGIKGFAWDKTNGGHSPTTAALGTATNWDRYLTDNKDMPGVLAITR